jgi:hypothetical protein
LSKSQKKLKAAKKEASSVESSPNAGPSDSSGIKDQLTTAILPATSTDKMPTVGPSDSSGNSADEDQLNAAEYALVSSPQSPLHLQLTSTIKSIIDKALGRF